jgi:hypothetical protein
VGKGEHTIPPIGTLEDFWKIPAYINFYNGRVSFMYSPILTYFNPKSPEVFPSPLFGHHCLWHYTISLVQGDFSSYNTKIQDWREVFHQTVPLLKW